MKKIILSLMFFMQMDVYSHEFNPAHLAINEILMLIIIMKLHGCILLRIFRQAEINFPDECAVEYGDLYYQGDYINEKINLDCSNSLKGLKLEIINQSVLTDALITINFLNDTFEGLVNVQNNIIDIPLEIQ